MVVLPSLSCLTGFGNNLGKLNWLLDRKKQASSMQASIITCLIFERNTQLAIAV